MDIHHIQEEVLVAFFEESTTEMVLKKFSEYDPIRSESSEKFLDFL